jgi:glycerol kinase
MNAIGSMLPNVKSLLEKYGDAKISNIKLNKTPVQGAVQFLLNKFSK